MRERIELGLVVVLAACGSPPSPSLVVPVAVAPPEPPAPPPPAAVPPPAPRELRETPEPACRIEAAGWSSDRLRLRADGPSFARADRVHTTLVLPVTESPREAMAVIDDGRVLLRAVIALADIHLFL